MQRKICLLGLLVLFLPGLCFAESKTTPEKLDGVTTIDVDSVKNWLDNGEDMVIFDARKSGDFDGGHIPTAESFTVPSDLTIDAQAIAKSVEALKQFPDLADIEKGVKIVTYCNGAT